MYKRQQQLLPKSVRKSLAFTLFKTARGLELAEDDLKEGIARHGECWNGAEADLREIKAKVEHLLVMGSEPTALDRIDAVTWRLEDYFENPSAEKVFRDADGKYVKGPARALTAALVAGLKPHEFKVEVESALQMKGNWKEDPVAVFGAVRAAALDWRVVERAYKWRSQDRSKPASPHWEISECFSQKDDVVSRRAQPRSALFFGKKTGCTLLPMPHPLPRRAKTKDMIAPTKRNTRASEIATGLHK